MIKAAQIIRAIQAELDAASDADKDWPEDLDAAQAGYQDELIQSMAVMHKVISRLNAAHMHALQLDGFE
jgi:hypothetical protein